MIIPYFTCTKCDTLNPELKPNLRISQAATELNDRQEPIVFNIRSVSVECKGCSNQKILKVTP